MVMEGKNGGGIHPRFKYMCSIFQGRTKIIHFLRLQKGVWLAKFFCYTKNEFYQGLLVFEQK